MPDKKLTDKDMLTLQRVIGKIKGVAFVVDNNLAGPLLDAVELIDYILDGKEDANNV